MIDLRTIAKKGGGDAARGLGFVVKQLTELEVGAKSGADHCKRASALSAVIERSAPWHPDPIHG